MLFNSVEFIFIFLPITFFVYFYLNNKRLSEASKAFLVFVSLIFYSWWNIVYLPLIISSMLFNYIVGSALSKDDTKNKKVLLTFGIILNLCLLGYFKYIDFFIDNFNILFNANISLLYLALPLAISFFTFQQIAYLVDSYKNETREYDFLNYSLFVTFFPQLIAGPIVHHKEMMPQFEKINNKVKNYRNIALGLFIFSLGLFKKIIIADHFAKVANLGYANPEILNIVESWVTSLSYTLQLYFDFSGYTDMAIGVALLFNIRLPFNFNSPYKALNIQDFWKRWHMTLSRFLRDYIYIPLGGNRKGEYKTYNNLMATFLLGGLWHGAGWTFIFWGFLHGFALIVYHLWSKVGAKLNKLLAWFITFNFINITWVFFRAENFTDALNILKSMFYLNNIDFPKFSELLVNIDSKPKVLAIVLIGLFVVIRFKNSNYYLDNFIPNKKYAAIFIFMFFMAVINLNKYQIFLYFNF